MTIKTLKLFLEQFPEDLEVDIELDGKIDEVTKIERDEVNISYNLLGDFKKINCDMVILK